MITETCKFYRGNLASSELFPRGWMSPLLQLCRFPSVMARLNTEKTKHQIYWKCSCISPVYNRIEKLCTVHISTPDNYRRWYSINFYESALSRLWPEDASIILSLLKWGDYNDNDFENNTFLGISWQNNKKLK